jgi:ATP-dependent DNA helicase RecG
LSLSGSRLPHASPSDSPQHLLENLNLLREGQPSRAALLLFGRRPQDLSSGIGVQIAQFKDGRILQERVIGGPLIEQVGEALDVLRVFLEVGYDIGDRAALEGRGDLSLLERVQRAEHWPYPLPALREALVNALIHREYTSSDRVQIRVSDETLEFWNPGGLPAGLSLHDLTQPGHPSRRRNPHLADTFYLAGLVERWGTGTTRMIDTMRQVGLPAPVFAEDSGGFRVTFRRDVVAPELLARLSPRQQQAVAYLRQHPVITNAQYRALTGVPDRTASLDLKKLLDLGVLIREGQGRNVAYRLQPAGFPQ